MNLNYTVSIKKNTNKLISSSNDKFIGIGVGTLIKLDNDPILYTPINRESLLYIKEFKTQNSKIIYIEDDVDINLQKNDIIKISYKEYEAKFITNIVDSGSGYFPQDNVNARNGILSIDISNGHGQSTIFEIEEIDSDNKVNKIIIKEPGKYIEPPQNPIEVYGKRGENLKLDVKYMELSNRSFIERIVEDIYISEGKTYIVLNYSIPPNLKEGKISCEKNILVLSQNYTGETRKNISYQIFTHFTPNIRLPLLVKDSLSLETVVNKALLIIDEELGKIKKKMEIN